MADEQHQQLLIRDLQSLLRESISKDVIVVSHTEKPLLAKGENFASTMLAVMARIKRTLESPEEILSLVAKTLPKNEAQLDSDFNRAGAFGKEIFAFEKWLPQLRELERRAGVKECDLLDILPRYYGGRLSLNKDLLGDEADEDTAMLMENLKDEGYYLIDKLTGLDYEHSVPVLRQIARFHALSTAMHIKNPAAFDQARRYFDVFPFDVKVNEFSENVEHIVNLVCTDSRVAPYAERIRSAVEAANGGMDFFRKIEPVEPWISVAHNDLWSSNCLFKLKNGKVEDRVKIIDYQFSRVGSPLRDIPYFILGNCQKDVVEKRFDQLLDEYYETFIKTLNRVGCDVSPFSRESFDEQLKRDAFGEMFRCIFAIKFFTFEAGEDTDIDDVKSSLIMSGANGEFFERAWRCIAKYLEKGWL